MSNLVEGMLVGRVDFGESSQARSASYSAEDAMAVTIVRLYRETDELRAEVAMLQQQARILAEERDEAREKAERYRNAMMAKLHELESLEGAK